MTQPKYKVIYETIAGSHLYGTNHTNSDTDIRGVAIEPVNCIIGLGTFEQHIETHDRDVTIWGLKKFVNLALANNPNILDVLFARPHKWIDVDFYWNGLYDIRHEFLSKRVVKTFGGYAEGQLKKLRNGNSNRVELVEKYGYDVKDACHLYRLTVKAIDILKTGDFDPELSGEQLRTAKGILNGFYGLEDVIKMSIANRALLGTMETQLPEKPNYSLVEKTVMNIYKDYLS